MSDQTCGFDGNSDLYGLGIRIGYYTQAMAAWFANWFVLSEVNGLRKTNILFLFAAMVALIVFIAVPGEVFAIELFAPLETGIMLGTVTSARQTSRTVGHVRLSVIQLSVYLCLQLAAHGLSLWYWSHGVGIMKPTPCGTYFFLFAKLSLYGPGRYVMLGFSALSAFVNVLGVIPWNVSILLRATGMRKSRRQFEQWAQDRIKSDDLKTDDTVTTTSPTDFDLTKIVEAEAYLDTIFAPSPKDTDVKLIVKRTQLTRTVWTWDGFVGGLRGNWSLFKINTFDFPSTKPRVMLATHFRDLPLPRPTWVDVIGRMIEERRNGRPPPNWAVLGLASEIQLAQAPTKTQVSWKRQAFGEFLLITFFITQVEATLSWNSIRMITTIRAIGQLIPFIVGVGGLGTVLWKKKGAVHQLLSARSKYQGLQPDPEPPSAFRDAVTVYLDWKAEKAS
ncbi:MAG: hypothetical protein M1814_000755 [Vezdaea aestivalis]|nr:MAG: hypothetical protein M1814_000755 [Vezdaea aestivalis]